MFFYKTFHNKKTRCNKQERSIHLFFLERRQKLCRIFIRRIKENKTYYLQTTRRSMKTPNYWWRNIHLCWMHSYKRVDRGKVSGFRVWLETTRGLAVRLLLLDPGSASHWSKQTHESLVQMGHYWPSSLLQQCQNFADY